MQPTGPLPDAVRGFIEDAAARVIHKEQTVLLKAWKRAGSDAESWRAELEKFYIEHTPFVVEQMRISTETAAQYVADQVRQQLAEPLDRDDWDIARLALVELAMAELEKVN
jgi:hypothetical protein